MQITFNSIPEDLQGLVGVNVPYEVKYVTNDRLVLSNNVIVLLDEAGHYTVEYPPITVGHLTATFDSVTGKLDYVKSDSTERSLVSLDVMTGLVRLTYMGVLEDSDYTRLHVQLMNAEDLQDKLKGIGVWV